MDYLNFFVVKESNLPALNGKMNSLNLAWRLSSAAKPRQSDRLCSSKDNPGCQATCLVNVTNHPCIFDKLSESN